MECNLVKAVVAGAVERKAAGPAWCAGRIPALQLLDRPGLRLWWGLWLCLTEVRTALVDQVLWPDTVADQRPIFLPCLDLLRRQDRAIARKNSAITFIFLLLLLKEWLLTTGPSQVKLPFKQFEHRTKV